MTERPTATVQVRCNGHLHRISLTKTGRLKFHHHKQGEWKSERVMYSFGGTCRCAEILEAWRKRHLHKLPERLKRCLMVVDNKYLRHWLSFLKRTNPTAIEADAVMTYNAELSSKDNAKSMRDRVAKILEERGWVVKTIDASDYTKSFTIALLNKIPISAQFSYSTGTDSNTVYVRHKNHYDLISIGGGGLGLSKFIADVEYTAMQKLLMICDTSMHDSKTAKATMNELKQLAVNGLNVGRRWATDKVAVLMDITVADETTTKALVKKLSSIIDNLRSRGKLIDTKR